MADVYLLSFERTRSCRCTIIRRSLFEPQRLNPPHMLSREFRPQPETFLATNVDAIGSMHTSLPPTEVYGDALAVHALSCGEVGPSLVCLLASAVSSWGASSHLQPLSGPCAHHLMTLHLNIREHPSQSLLRTGAVARRSTSLFSEWTKLHCPFMALVILSRLKSACSCMVRCSR